MTYTVVKFGGSNLKDSHGVAQVLDAIKSYNKPLVIVVSAFYGMTNRLIGSVELAKNKELDVQALTDDISDEKFKLVSKFIKNDNLLDWFKLNLDLYITRLKNLLNNVYSNGIYLPEEYAEIVSTGEKLSALCLKYLIKNINIECQLLLPEEFGLITDNDALNATVNLSESKYLLSRELNNVDTYIIPGFYGKSKNGKICLLGRGGSDYSAACIAHCINAKSLDLWKDVAGFLSANPNLVSKTISINSLTYSEAAELAYFGSEILHPRTAEPLAEVNIPINILSIQNATKSLIPSTIINNKKVVHDAVIKSISYSDDYGIVKLNGAGVGVKPGILAKVAGLLDVNGINIKSVFTSQTTINILLSIDSLEKAKLIIEANNISGINHITIIDNISLIAAVGEGLTTIPGVAGRLFTAVAKQNINIKIISFGASNVAVYFIVNKLELNVAVNAIHNELFCSEKKEPVKINYVN